MAKKILVFVAAIMAFAVVPAVASATNSPELVENGTKVENGARVQGTNSGIINVTNALGENLWMCETAVLTGQLLKNDGSNIEGNITAANFTGCPSIFGSVTVTTAVATNGLPWCIRSTSTMVTDEFQVRGNSCTSVARPIRFVLDNSMVGTSCTYQRNGTVSGSFTTGLGSTLLSISKVEIVLLEGGVGCPGATYLDMKVMLETDESNTRLDLT